MIKRIIPLLLCAVLLLTGLCSCSLFGNAPREENSVAEEDKPAADPMVTLVNAINNSDVGGYKNAFPTDYTSQLKSDTDESLTAKLRDNKTVDSINYGTGSYIRFSIRNKNNIEPSAVNEGYTDAYVSGYQLDTSKITAAKEISFNVTLASTNSSATSTTLVTLMLIEIDGRWFIHPKSFGTVLK